MDTGYDEWTRTLNTMSLYALGKANQDKEPMVFDWHKAAQLIKEKKPTFVQAGLAGDWSYTGDKIYENGEPKCDQDLNYCYLKSTWATPTIELDGVKQDCFVMAHEQPEWHAKTLWPQSALDILRSV